MKLLDPETIAKFLKSYSQMEYDPDNKRYRRKAFYDTQTVAVAAAAPPTQFFGTTTSSSGLHGRLLIGCNLPTPGRLPGNTVFIVDTITIHLLQLNTAALVVDGVKFAEFGLVNGIFVKNEPAIDEFPAAEAIIRRGVAPVTAGEGTAAAVISAVTGLEDGKQLTPESYAVIKDNAEFRVDVSYNGTANLSAVLMMRVALEGLEIRNR